MGSTHRKHFGWTVRVCLSRRCVVAWFGVYGSLLLVDNDEEDAREPGGSL